MKNKSKAKEFFENTGFIGMLIWMLPILIYEGIDELCEKRRKAKEPKPDVVKFVCSKCGETFTARNDEKEMYKHGNDGYSYSKPMECPKCHHMKTNPTSEIMTKVKFFLTQNKLCQEQSV